MIDVSFTRIHYTGVQFKKFLVICYLVITVAYYRKK